MCRCLSIVCFLALMAQGCAKNPPVIPLSALNVDYRTWSCRHLAQETDLLRDSLAVASEQHSDETIAHLKVEKKCSFEEKNERWHSLQHRSRTSRDRAL